MITVAIWRELRNAGNGPGEQTPRLKCCYCKSESTVLPVRALDSYRF